MSLHDIELMSFGQLEEWTFGLSCPAVEGLNNHGLSAPLWLSVSESGRLRLFTQRVVRVSMPGPVWRAMQSRSSTVCSFDVTPAGWISAKEMEVPAAPAGAYLATLEIFMDGQLQYDYL